jgi:hypothetical protein
MAYSEHPGSEELTSPDAPESGEVRQDDRDAVKVGDGFAVDSLRGINADFRLRLLEREHPELKDIRRRLAQAGLDEKPVLEMMGTENILRNFCCQMMNYLDVVIHYFNVTVFDEWDTVIMPKNVRVASPTPLLLRNRSYAESAKNYVGASRLPGKDLIELFSIQEQVQRLLTRFDG